MADVITRFKLETTQYDSKLRDASKGLADITRQASLAGSEFGKFTQKNVEAARALGNITPSATNAKDKVKELVGAFNDVAKAYNALTKEQQQSDFGKALAESMTTLKGRITEAKQELYDLGSAAEQVKSKAGGGLFGESGLTGMLAVTGGNLIASGISKLTSELTETVQQSIELARSGEGVRLAFDRLNQPGLLNNLKEATHGTVSELELMKAAVKFDDFKLPVEQLGTLLAFAQKKAKDTGQSVDYMVDSIVTGLGRKSLMILDNLGLSAAQIKERMAETGDMTTAVASIIKEQMSEAGEYVETAADRAARAAADAQNQMEELGRKAMPVAEEWGKAWNEIKISGMEVITFVLTPIAESLKDIREILSGEYTLKIKAEYDTPLGSNVDDNGNYIKRPANGNWAGFDAENGTWKPGYSGAIYNSATGQTELPEVTVNGQKRTKTTNKRTNKTATVSGPSMSDFEKFINKSGLGADSLKGSDDANFLSPYALMLDEIKEKILDIQDTDWTKTFGGVSDEYLSPLQRMNKELAIMKANLESAPTTEAYQAGLQAIADKEKEIANFKGIDLSKDAKSTAKSFQEAASAISAVGSAMQSIEDPTAKIAGLIAQAIANIAVGFSEMIGKDIGSKGNVWYGIATAAAGMASMMATISQIHSATGYAEGGIVKGNSYSGDNIGGVVDGSQFVGLNAGELVLNASQQSMLANNLKGSGGDGGGYTPSFISGEQIYIALNRYTRRSGKGELVTWR